MAHSEANFGGAGSVRIVYDIWTPDVPPVATLVLAHGFGEHAGRYERVIERLLGLGVAVYAPDHRGHGRSGGKRVHALSLGEFTADLDTLFGIVADEHPGLPRFLLGHSMGGAISLTYALDHPDRLAGLMLSGPAIIVTTGVPAPLVAIGSTLGRFLPQVPVQSLSPDQVSRDPAVVAAYEADPLVYHGKVPAGIASAMATGERDFAARLSQLRVPTLVQQGTADSLVDPAGARRVRDLATGADVTVEEYEGLYHEIFHEPEQDRVLDDLVAWLAPRLPKAGV